METGKLYKLNKVEGLEWVFIWDHPYIRNHVMDKLPVGKPYMFIGNEPNMSVWCKILVEEKIGWIHIRGHSITEIKENGG